MVIVSQLCCVYLSLPISRRDTPLRVFQVGFVSDGAAAGTSSSASSTGAAAAAAAAVAAEPYDGVGEALWSLEYETGATEQWARIVLACVLACWVPVWLAWCWAVFYYKAQGGFKVRFWLFDVFRVGCLSFSPVGREEGGGPVVRFLFVCFLPSTSPWRETWVSIARFFRFFTIVCMVHSCIC